VLIAIWTIFDAESCLGFTVPHALLKFRSASASSGSTATRVPLCIAISDVTAPLRPPAVVARPSANVRPAAAATVGNAVQAARLPTGATSRRAPAMCPPYKHPPACACIGRSTYPALLPQRFPTTPAYAQWHSAPRGCFLLMASMLISCLTADHAGPRPPGAQQFSQGGGVLPPARSNGGAPRPSFPGYPGSSAPAANGPSQPSGFQGGGPPSSGPSGGNGVPLRTGTSACSELSPCRCMVDALFSHGKTPPWRRRSASGLTTHLRSGMHVQDCWVLLPRCAAARCRMHMRATNMRCSPRSQLFCH